MIEGPYPPFLACIDIPIKWSYVTPRFKIWRTKQPPLGLISKGMVEQRQKILKINNSKVNFLSSSKNTISRSKRGIIFKD